MNKKNWLQFGIAFLIVAIFGAFVLPNEVYRRLSFFMGNGYFYLVYVALFIAVILVVLGLFNKIKLSSRWSKIIYGILFLPIVFFPLFKCYFKVPYIFCKRCPRKCPWGLLRPVLVPSLLVLNLDKRFWCFKMCPLGTLQDYQSSISNKRIILPKWLRYIRYVFLALTIFVVVKLLFNLRSGEFFFKFNHHFYIWSFSVILVIFILSFFIPRFWCNYLCPVGSFSDVVLKIERKIKKLFKK